MGFFYGMAPGSSEVIAHWIYLQVQRIAWQVVYSEVMKAKKSLQNKWISILIPTIAILIPVLTTIKDAAGWGIFTGAALVLVPFAGVVTYLKRAQKKRKVAKKRVFYEPTQPKMFLYYITSILGLLIFFTLTMAIPVYGEWLTNELDNNTYWAGVIMMFYIVSLLVVPMFAYMVYILTKYDKVVEYKTRAWYKYRESLKKDKGEHS